MIPYGPSSMADKPMISKPDISDGWKFLSSTCPLIELIPVWRIWFQRMPSEESRLNTERGRLELLEPMSNGGYFTFLSGQ